VFDALVSLLALIVSGPLVVVVIAAGALVATRLTSFVILRLIRRLAQRSLREVGSLDQSGLWRARSLRISGETGEMWEHRRRQRIDAASRMVNHLVAVVIWIVAAIVTFHLLAVDPAFFLSSAGFIGAGLAIGGQHKVNDYLTGLSVHFEDRYGVGDEILADIGWEQPVRAVVDHIGLFSTRLRDERSTLHLPNSSLVSVRNLSQEAAQATLRVRVPDEEGVAEHAADVLRGLAGSDGLTDVVFVGEMSAQKAATGEVEIDVRTSRPLGRRAANRLVERAERSVAGGAER
jgi:small-conductance mechanosensitive channel